MGRQELGFSSLPECFIIRRMTNRRAWLISLLALAVAAAAVSASPMQIRSVEKDAKGVSVKFDPGVLRLEVCSDRILRVSYSPTENIPARQDFSVVNKWQTTSFTVTE